MSNSSRSAGVPRTARTTRSEASPWRARASIGVALLAISSVAALGSGTPGAGASALDRSRPQLTAGLTLSFSTPNGAEIPYQGPLEDLGGSALGVEYGLLVTVKNTTGRAVRFPSPGAHDLEYAKPATHRGEFLMDEEDCVTHSPLAAGGACKLILLWILPATGAQRGAFTVTYTSVPKVTTTTTTTSTTTTTTTTTSTTTTSTTSTTTTTVPSSTTTSATTGGSTTTSGPSSTSTSSSTTTTSVPTTTTTARTTTTTARTTTTTARATTTTARTTTTTRPVPVTAHSSLVVQAEGEEGYYVVGRANQISGFGYVDTGIDKVTGQKLGHPIVGAAVDPGGSGLLTVSSNGAVFNFGEAPNYGSALGKKLHAPIVGIAAHTTALPSAKGSLIDGYWLVSSAGAIFTYGKAHYYGSVGGHLQTPIVGMALTSDGAGYWLATGGGGVLSYGDARYLGSMGGKHLRAPIVAIASTPHATGYWLFAADGEVLRFGSARNFGSPGPRHLTARVVGASATPDGLGYYILERNGTVLDYGDAADHGSANSTMAKGHLAVAIAQDGSFVTPSDVLPSLRASQLRASQLRASFPSALRSALPAVLPSAVRPGTPSTVGAHGLRGDQAGG